MNNSEHFVIDRNSVLWAYLSNDVKGLVFDGELLLRSIDEVTHRISDYSFLVFPFSKAYEGFLKRLFLDLNLIREDEYYGDEIRIGRVLNPGYVHEHQNVFEKLCRNTGADGNNVSLKLWEAWKKGRNQVFHYFPHNYRKLSYDEAIDLIKGLVSAMEYAVGACNLKTNSLL